MTDHAPLTDEELAAIKHHFAYYPVTRRLIAEVERLRAALTDAIEEMEDMIAYVPDCFREKWEYDKAIVQAKAALHRG